MILLKSQEGSHLLRRLMVLVHPTLIIRKMKVLIMLLRRMSGTNFFVSGNDDALSACYDM